VPAGFGEVILDGIVRKMSSQSSQATESTTPTTPVPQGDAGAEGDVKPEEVPANLAIETEDATGQNSSKKEWKRLEIVGDVRINEDGSRNEEPATSDWESDCPLFMTKLPDDPSQNPYLSALEAIANDEVDREYTAEELKARGNVCFQRCVVVLRFFIWNI
jgi:hypothetical protein